MDRPRQLLHQVFEDQVRKHPANHALDFYPHERLSYQELNERSNSLARFLCETQVPGREVVALCPDKSPLLIIAVLAVLKAGMVWMPLPTGATADQMQYILQCSRAGLVLGSGPSRPGVRTDLAFIALDDMFQGGKRPPYASTNLDHVSQHGKDLCHILFTSGSTGTPKGVMMEHGAVRHNAVELTKMFNLDSHTRTLQFAAPTFDVFGLDLFMTFACGGCIVLAPREVMMEDMTAFLRKTHITYAQLTPTVIQTIDPEGVPSLRVLASSGEVLPSQLASRWRRRVRMFNAYGPTETAVCTVQDLGEDEGVDAACIGRPVPGLDVRLLDDGGGQAVRAGEVGEICVAGPQLLRGYLSPEGAVRPPECHMDGVRFYRTGDLGRSELSPAGLGTIRLIGRRDAEVKLRGIRLDLADVERCILKGPYVTACVVVLPRRGSSSGSLCSFVVLPHVQAGTGPETRLPLAEPSVEIRRMLHEAKGAASSRLPASAMPKTWWPVGEIPLTASAKVDRFCLQSWLEELEEATFRELVDRFGAETADRAVVAGPGERLLQSAWAEVLLRPASSIASTASLAELGADSLDVIRMAARARNVGINVSAADIFTAKTIQELVRHCQSLANKTPRVQPSPSPTYRPFSLLSPTRPLAPLMDDVAKACRVSVAAVEDIYPCTPYQAALMALDIKCPGSYICAFSWTLRHDADVDRLQGAWDGLLASQPVLRNRLVWDATMHSFIQVQIRHRPARWSESLHEAAMSLGSDLCRGLVRWQEERQRWTFHLKIHHSIIDGWSLQLMLNQLKKIYFGEVVNTLDAAPFAHFVRHHLDGQQSIRSASEQFWTDYLKDCSHGEFPPTPQDAHHEVHATHHRSLAVPIDMQGLASCFGVTPAVILYGITALILATHSDTPDIVMGLILAGRDASLDGLFHMLGPAFACVPFRTQIDHHVPLYPFFQHIQSQILAIAPHQQYGLERINKCGPGAAAACQLKTLVVVQPEDERSAGSGLWDEVHGQSSGLADSVPFSLELILADQSILVNCNSDPALVSPHHAQTVIDHLSQALQSLSSLSSQETVGHIQLTHEHQHSRMLQWAESYGSAVNACLHTLLQTSVEKFADRTAIRESATERRLTFRELDVFSSRLAIFLAESCLVSEQTIVAMAMDKCALAVVTIFAILKTGSAYLPLDPSWPLERVRRIVDDAGAAAIVCSPAIADGYTSLRQQLIPLHDSHWKDQELQVLASAEWAPRGSPSDLAVLMYTSGSTGVPKGVMLEHGALSTSLMHLARAFALQPGYHHLQFSSFVYDVSIADIFIPLLSGACICVPTEDDRLNRLSATIRRMEINSAILTPSMTGLVAPQDASTLKTIMTGGEMTSRALIRTWAPLVRLLNAYGPTEASITTTVTDPLKVDSDPGIIGRNVTGWHLILRRNNHGELYEAPFGCTGEIAIAGHSLARGYLHNIELTNKHFVTFPHLHKSQLPSRVYLTGDIGRYESDGSMRILGRRDRMMKINGIRVDPGEAEDRLRRLGGPFASVVVQCTLDKANVCRLVAFVTVDGHNSDSTASRALILDARTTFYELCRDARRRLLEHLPISYVPSLFVPISHVPRTASDKIDYKRLRAELQKFPLAPFLIASDGETDHDPMADADPATPTERAMEGVFRNVFHVQGRLGVAADFFRLGGDSFAAIKLASVAREHSLEITVQQVYRYPRLKDLAAVARYKTEASIDGAGQDEGRNASWSVRVPDEVWREVRDVTGFALDEMEDVYPASPFQEGLMAASLHGVTPNGVDEGATYQAKLVFQLAAETDADRLAQAMDKVVSQNPILRTTLVSSTRGLMQIARKKLPRDRDAPFHYEIETASCQHPTRLVMRMHHALYDGPTIHLLLQDINFWYGEPDGIRIPPVPYRRFVEYLLSTASESASEYWTENLRDAPLTPFPPVCENENRTAAIQHVHLSTTVCLDLPRQCGISAATLAAGAVALLLSAYSFAEQVCFGMTLSGRDSPELERIAGPTLSTVPMRVHMCPQQSVLSFLQRLQSSLLDMRQHQHFGLKNILRLPGQGPRNAGQFRTLLVMQQGPGQSSSEEQPPGVVEKLLPDESSMHVENPLVIIGHVDSLTGHVDLKVEHDVACVSHVQARRFIQQLGQAITELSLPHRPLSELDLASSADRAEIAAWNPKPSAAPSRGICQIFQDMALQRPGLPAVEAIVGGQGLGTVHRMTYKQLDGASTALSYAIGRCAPNSRRIALCHGRPSLVLTAMLAVWKAGKAFATLDPSAPADRRQHILADLGDDTVVLTDSSEAQTFAPFSVFILDSMLQEAESKPDTDDIVRHANKASDTAYVLYTSGSSGTPKGVVVRHSAIALSLLDIGATMGLNSETRMLQFATCAFDTSLLEIFATLMVGGCVCIPSRSQRLDGNLGQAINQLQVSHLVLTPTIAALLSPAHLPTVRSLMLVGEPPTKQLVPTKLAPVGAIGELVICGNTVADGYLNQPEQTKQEFGTDPLWAPWTEATSRVRFYRTGDLARYASDGSLTYLGRKDLQVKMHGQRVELSEIEWHISRSAQFADCIVDIVPPGTLVAFVLSRQIDEAAVSRTQSRLRCALPKYMVPHVFVPYGCWPTTTSGKIDRRQLRASVESSLDNYRVRPRGSKRPARNLAQKALFESIAEAMSIAEDQIGLDDSVVSLGGDSITMIRILALSRQRKLNIDVSRAYPSSTLEDLAMTPDLSLPTRIGEDAAPPPPFSLITWLDREGICAKAADQCQVPIASITDVYPCTSMQQSLMISSAKAPGAFLNQEVFQLPPGLSVPKLIRAIQSLWQRHDILRARIILQDECRGLQVVLREDAHVSRISTEKLDEFLLQDSFVAFGYGTKLSRCAHHAVFDGWSMNLFKHEMQILYAERGLGLPPTQPYALFARHAMNISNNSAAHRYWQTRLADIQSGSLPQVRQAAAFAANQKYALTVQLPSEPAYMLATLAEASWGVLLGRYLDCEDVSFGVVRSGRAVPLSGIDMLMGPTLASIPRRLRAVREQKVAAYLRQVQVETTQAMPWEQFGLSNIRKIDKDAFQACKFNSMLVVQPPAVHPGPEDKEAFLIPQNDVSKGFVDSDCLIVECQPTGDDQVIISISYDDRLTSSDDARWMAYHFSHTLQELGTNETGTIGDLVMSGSERLVQECRWNSIRIDACHQLVDELFSDRASQWPDFPAVEAPDASLTYEQLNTLSSAGASRLQLECGVCRGDLVPLLMSKGAAMIVAMLSVLKAGAAYVPLPTDAPSERLCFLMGEINSPIVVTTADQDSLIRTLSAQPITWDIEELSKGPCPEPVGNDDAVKYNHCRDLRSHSDLAYILFTSGSSGTPKGVMIEHSALAATALINGRDINYQAKTRTLSFASYTFDVNVMEIFLTLLHGGCLYIPPENRRLGDLCAYMEERQIELAFLTPTAIQNILYSSRRVPSLKTLCSGGEPLTKSIVQEWAASVRLINSYGPTETCFDACRNPHVTIDGDPNNIGFAIGTHLWVVELGNYGSLAPVGSAGELLISGPTLARGYLKDQQRSQAAFIDGSQFPWVQPGEERLYVSGDIVRRNPNGSITFIGRRDQQIKLNGFRIELGEIEQCLERCPSVVSAVADKVTSQEDCSEMLVAFLTLALREQPHGRELLLPPAPDTRSIIQGVQARIDGLLPQLMAPRVYLPLSRIPLTPSGKMDRKALQALVGQLPPEQILLYQAASSVIRQPSTVTERILQGLWAQVLKVNPKHLGLDTQFTRVGGDSLTAINLASLCREVGFKLEVADILRMPQLEHMANHVERNQQRAKVDGQYINIQTTVASKSWRDPRLLSQVCQECSLSINDIEDVYPCTPIQEALMAATVRQPKTYIDHSMFLVPPSTDPERLRTSWDVVHQANAILRTRLCPATTDQGVQMMQVVTRRPSLWIDADNEVDSAIDMGLGTPLVRYRIRPSGKAFIFEMWRHHSIFDGFSSLALWQDLEHAFAYSVPPKPRPSYRTFVDFVQGADKAEAVSFWQAQLDGHQPEAFPALPSPDYLPQADSNTSQTLESRLSWSSASTFSFATVARAAWAAMLAMRSRSSGVAKDVCFAVTLSGRTAPLAGIEDIVGPTITTIPVRTQFELDDPVSQFLEHVQDQALDMLPFEHFGLGRIREISLSARDACACVNLLVLQPAQLGDTAVPLGLRRMSEATNGLRELFGLVMECSQNSAKDHVSISAAYDPSLLTGPEVRHILEQFQQMIGILSRRACDNSTIRSAFWELAEGADLGRTVEWNLPGDQSPPPQLHELVEETARHHPEQLAVDCHDGQLSYAELVAASGTLALYLQSEHGVRPGHLVPICTEKSRLMVVGILGIIKAGAGYVPLDTNHPEARIQHIIHEIRPQVIIVSPLQATRRRFPLRTLVLDWEHLSAPGPPRTLYSSCPDDVAYVIFTSGSSGAPKGVVMEHKAASRSVLEHAKRFQHDRQGVRRRSLQFSSYAFDVSVIDIFAVLASGGCVCIPSEAQAVDNLEGFIQSKRIDFANLTPTVANLLDPVRTPTLKTLAIGGEMANRALLHKWTSRDSPVELFVNAYGPTEAGISCAAGLLTATSLIGYVGKPLATGLWIVDEHDHNHLVPVGSVGELVVTGSTLARGYLNDEEQSRQSFLEHVPWLAKVGQGRLYKTGDLARFDVNGHVELVGRREDTQVKLRGLRIELGEIEAAIGASSWASRIQRVVVAKILRDGIPLLAAFVQFSPDECLSTPDLASIFCRPSEQFLVFVGSTQESLRKQLPEYMVPRLWLPVSAWPLLRSSKTDRKSLAASAEALDSKRVFAYQRPAPINGHGMPLVKLSEREEVIKEAWLQVLHKDAHCDVGPHDDFFQLGGDSLTTIMLVTALRQRGICIAAHEVFAEKTLRGMAACVGTTEVEEIYPASYTQLAFLVEAQKWPRSYYLWTFFELDDRVAADRVQKACRALVDRHAILRTSFHFIHGQCFQAIGCVRFSTRTLAVQFDSTRS
ncbi:AMP-binding enzyme domain-containing protein [Hirsutella rhossiliensis]|uniref:AMP-binding enzyme domain-containing protein n=1 Tax=Hirsutella rhossiliensis TaxID=111463 RepID=A0A9P8N438_9HYPO|nr:AMP-binding enzyme domain-containing protein [Hirsutella rhossiliensis]KAH0966459.1 AMP-binding enzyme domain-containing protein [Hirsutella rhossiliensis]